MPKLMQYTSEGWVEIKGERGIDGRDGRDAPMPSDKKIREVVRPLIPKPIPGRDGRDGKDGKDGNSVSVEDVLAEIRPELEKMMNEFRTAIRSMKPAKGGGGGGGGLSTPTTFSFSGDGSTTSFTLSTKVAANGLACWAYLNGQWIQPGVHFNISGTTLTTTFTPADGDTLEGFYLRT